MQNIEIKYQISNPDDLRDYLSINSEIAFQFRHHQKDIYFNVPKGRVKIRIEDENKPCLIEYYRPDKNKPRISDYMLTPLEDVDVTLKQLETNLGISVIVEKWRELYFYKNVRIHLDEVANLGWFLEFESVISEDCDKLSAQKNLEEILQLLSPFLNDSLSTGYMNMLIDKKIIQPQ